MNASTKVSIITPTANRGHMLGAILGCVRGQDHRDLEWLVLDDGDSPCETLLALKDPRVSYTHTPEKLSVGEKRNRLIAQAKGEVIVQFDDDDHYAPRYVSTMLSAMRANGAAFVKLAAFFLYHAGLDRYAFWDLNDRRGHHFIWGSRNVACTLIGEDNDQEIRRVLFSYGFSYVFHRSVWEAIPFEDISFGEDGHFIDAALGAGTRCALVNDHLGLCMHVIHRDNSSKCFPQYLIPEFMIADRFPGFDKRDYGRR